MKRVVILFLGCFILSCQSHSPEEKRIFAGETRNFEIGEHICPDELFIVDSFLITLNTCRDSFFLLYNLNQNKARWFGLKGRGPNEFLNLRFAGDISSDRFSVFSRSKNQLTEISPAKAFQGLPFITKRVSLPPSYYRVSSDIMYANGYWFGADLSGKSTFYSINPISGELKEIGFTPKVNIQYPNQTRSYLYYSITNYSNINKMAVSAMVYFPYVRIISPSGKLVHSFYTKSSYSKPELEPNAISVKKSANHYCWDVEFNDKYIYLLNPGITESQLRKGEIDSTSIDIYSWKGKYKATILFDCCIGNFTIDAKNKKIYGINLTDPENPIAQVSIPKSLHHFFL